MSDWQRPYQKYDDMAYLGPRYRKMPQWVHDVVPTHEHEAILAGEKYFPDGESPASSFRRSVRNSLRRAVIVFDESPEYYERPISEDKKVKIMDQFWGQLPKYSKDRIDRLQPERIAKAIRKVVEWVKNSGGGSYLSNLSYNYGESLEREYSPSPYVNDYPVIEKTINGPVNALKDRYGTWLDFQEAFRALNMTRTNIMEAMGRDPENVWDRRLGDNPHSTNMHLAPAFFYLANQGYHCDFLISNSYHFGPTMAKF